MFAERSFEESNVKNEYVNILAQETRGLVDMEEYRAVHRKIFKELRKTVLEVQSEFKSILLWQSKLYTWKKMNVKKRC